MTPIALKVKSRILNFWCRIISGKQEKICCIMYKLLYSLHLKNVFHSPWIKFVHDTLDELGMSENWLLQSVNHPLLFKHRIKTVLHDQYLQKWKANIFNSTKCLNYRIYKSDFEFEKYLTMLPPSLASFMSKFRCSSHKMPIEQGRFFGIQRNDRICNICNRDEIGDEFHYLFKCDYFTEERRKYIPEEIFRSPNTFKYNSFMNSTDKNPSVKMSLFMKIIVTKFN